MATGEGAARHIVVFAPTTQLSIAFERTTGGDELHVHPAGQGYWITRMLAVLGSPSTLCTPLGGETGVAVRALLGDMPADGLIDCPTANGAYVHDRRGGERCAVATFPTPCLDRHLTDDLVSTTLALGAQGLVVVCGTNLERAVSPWVFEHLCRDLQVCGAIVVADLSGDELRAGLAGGIGLLKISADELVADGWSATGELADVVVGVRRIREAGAHDVVVSGVDGAVVALLSGRWYRAQAPTMSVVEHRGAGDSMTAALAHGRASGLDDEHALQLATAAAALNVTRHGLASGRLAAIDRFRDLVTVEPLPVT